MVVCKKNLCEKSCLPVVVMSELVNVDSDEIKEVYARFGLAVYAAQVLEHGIVNALVILDLVPARRRLADSFDEWASEVDAFTDRHFQSTMGRMMKMLRSATKVDETFERLLSEALRKRNWLVHDFFRERATEFITSRGRMQMLAEVDECRDLFASADVRLENIVAPLREKAGVKEELLGKMEEQMRREAEQHTSNDCADM